MKISFFLNTREVSVDIKDLDSLYEFLQNNSLLRFPSLCTTKLCNQCAVLLGNDVVPSCLLSLITLEHKQIFTSPFLFQSHPFLHALFEFSKKHFISLCASCKNYYFLVFYSYFLQKTSSKKNPSASFLGKKMRLYFNAYTCSCLSLTQFELLLQELDRFIVDSSLETSVEIL